MRKLNLPQFVFINGPAGSGKSTLAELLCAAEPSVWRESFAEPIRAMLWAVWYPDNDPMRPMPNLRDGAVKQSPMPIEAVAGSHDRFYTHRQEMIAFSEEYLKRRYGQRIFGKLLLRRTQEQVQWYSTFVIDDSGFAPEVEEVIDAVGKDNCHLIRLHRSGHDFRGDSRGYITLPEVQTLDLENNGAPNLMMDMLALEFGNL